MCENYSHGMRQKIVMSAALIHDPRVLVIDEPMVGLDPLSARTVKTVLRERVADGCAVLMSTHTLSVAEEVADRVGIIHRGRLIAEGTCEELRRQASARGRRRGRRGGRRSRCGRVSETAIRTGIVEAVP